MARYFVLSAAAVALFFVSGLAIADNIGVGKPTNATASTTEITTQDNIGVGEENWYDLLIGWFESE